MKKPNYIYEAINENHVKSHVSFHMPGHKARGEFKSAFPGCVHDVTELSFSDDLQHPTGAIDKAQKDIAQILGAKRSYITTDGSSSGVMAMVYVASKFGNKIIVPRNSHKSVYNACRIMGVEPVIVQGEEREGVLLPPDPVQIERLIVNDVSIAGVLITSPDYYGNVAPLKEYAALVKRHTRFLFIDGAHGTHLAFEANKDLYAGTYADMWVDGAHKTMPTLTQGAVVSVNNERLFAAAEEGLCIFRTSSPSYPIMASVEYGIKWIAENPKCIERAKQAAAEFKRQMTGFTFYDSDDWTKLAVDCAPLDIDPADIASFLERKNIYVEMTDGRYLLLYLSPMTEASDFNKLKPLLISAVAQKSKRKHYKPRKPYPVADRTYSYLYALRQRSEYVPLADAVGRMCAENAGLTPPCFPIVVAGEMITADAVAALQSGKSTFGVYDGRVKVVAKR
jgi:arginine/lysine/ornithine decarboxylase